MAAKPAHLVERVAERLLHAGLLESSAARLLAADHAVSPCPSAAIGHASPQPAAGIVAPALLDGAPRQPDDRPPPIVDIAALERTGMLNRSGGRSRVSEEFRLAQQQLLRAAFAPEAEAGIANLVMVTSARPGEGKSFTALNLACSIAAQGDHDVLLIDCDSKRQSISQRLGLADAPGVLDLAADSAIAADRMVVRTEIKHLFFLPLGRERGHGSELFASRDMTQVIQRFGRAYANRLVMLDAAPCLSTSDPAALAPVVGQIVMVVEAERTQRDEVEAALDLLQACPSIVLVLNKAQASNRHAFGAYSSHYSS